MSGMKPDRCRFFLETGWIYLCTQALAARQPPEGHFIESHLDVTSLSRRCYDNRISINWWDPIICRRRHSSMLERASYHWQPLNTAHGKFGRA